MHKSLVGFSFWCGLVFLVAGTGCSTSRHGDPNSQRPNQPYILGADISWVLEDEAEGAVYYDHGVKKDPFDILKENGFNYVRLRVFVDPKSERGYARRRNEAFCDLPHLLTMARRAKSHDMGILVDLMFSDSWADPEHQPKPFAWEGLPFDGLVEKVREHTREVVTALQKQGTPPNMVQVGNETTHGLLWPDARVASLISSGNAATDAKMKEAGIEGLGHYDQFATILKASIGEIRAIDPSIRVVLHNHLGRSSARVQEWLENLISRDVKFDVVGFSCYAQGAEGDWKQTFAHVTRKYPGLEILVLEYSARKRYVNDLVYAIPDGRGIGSFVWEPTRHREAIFDKDGKNAGGGQASNFVAGIGIDQGASSRPTTTATSRPTSRPGPTSRPRRSNGGRYDTNEFLQLYPQMSRDYGNQPSTRRAD